MTTIRSYLRQRGFLHTVAPWILISVTMGGIVAPFLFPEIGIE